ncbi:phage I-like protein [Bradyrhizobium sp. GM5.1]
MSKDQRDSKKRIALVQLFAERSGSADLPSEIHVIPTGEWAHPIYGPMIITAADIAEFKKNFDDKVRRDIPITQGHDNGMSGGELPAVGWFKESIDRGVNGLYCTVEWTPEGEKLLTEGSFKYLSPEFYEIYDDPETHEVRKNVLVGAALTNKPYFKELDQVYAFSEEISKQINIHMNLKDITIKKFSELSTEEKGFLKEHKAELSTEQLATFAEVFTEDNNGGGEGDGGADEGNGGGEGAGEIEASEKKGVITMDAAEVAALRVAAEAGVKALQKVEATERKEVIAKMTFSASNPTGKFLPRQDGALESFLKTLSESQRDAFVQLVGNMPKLAISMSEIGDGGKDANVGADSIAKEVQKLASEKMTSDTKLTYSKAVLAVFAEKPELKADYDKAMDLN